MDYFGISSCLLLAFQQIFSKPEVPTYSAQEHAILAPIFGQAVVSGASPRTRPEVPGKASFQVEGDPFWGEAMRVCFGADSVQDIVAR